MSTSCTKEILSIRRRCYCFFFFFNDTATTEIYTLSLHDALPISLRANPSIEGVVDRVLPPESDAYLFAIVRSEEHTSELQSQSNLVCRLLLEKKKKNTLTRTWTSYCRTQTFESRTTPSTHDLRFG